MKVKKAIAFGVIGLIGLFAFGSKKVSDISQIASQLQVKIKGIKDIKFSIPNVNFKIKLNIINPTDLDFSAALGSGIIIKRIRVYSGSNIFLGDAILNASNIEIPAKSIYVLDNVHTEIDIREIGNEFFENINNYVGNDFSRLNYKIDVEVFGKIITLDT